MISPCRAVGVLAGNGIYPHLLAERLVQLDFQVVAAGIAGQTRPGPIAGAAHFKRFPLGAIRRTAAFFRRFGVSQMYFAGGVGRPVGWRHLRPDGTALRVMLKHVLRGDDALLRSVASAFENLGMTVADPGPYLGDLLAQAGHLGGPAPSPEAAADLSVAWRAAKRLGRRDRGQAAIARRGRVIGVEGIRGTDALLAAHPGEGGVLAKVVKPGQDRRFDLPAIGPDTIVNAQRAGICAIGIEAGGVLLLERSRIIEACGRLGVALVGVSQEGPAGANGATRGDAMPARE